MREFFGNPILDPHWFRPGEKLPSPTASFSSDDRVVIARWPYFDEPGRVLRAISSSPPIYEVILDRTGTVIHVQPKDMIFLYHLYREIKNVYDALGSDYAAMKAVRPLAKYNPIALKYSGDVVAVVRLPPFTSDGDVIVRSDEKIPAVRAGWLEISDMIKFFSHTECLAKNEIKAVLNLTAVELVYSVGETYGETVLKDVSDFARDPDLKRCWSLSGWVRYYAPAEKFLELKKRILGDT